MRHDANAHLVEVDAGLIFGLTRPDDRLLTLYVIYCVLSTAAFPFVFLPLYFKFITLRYRFDEEGVAVSHGLIWRQETYLTYARIQDIHVRRNVFERWLGLGTVEIQTAAGSSSAEAEIVGVKEYDAIRNFLYARMRGHRLGLKLEEQPAGGQDVREVLAGIRDELRAIRTMLEARPDV